MALTSTANGSTQIIGAGSPDQASLGGAEFVHPAGGFSEEAISTATAATPHQGDLSTYRSLETSSVLTMEGHGSVTYTSVGGAETATYHAEVIPLLEPGAYSVATVAPAEIAKRNLEAAQSAHLKDFGQENKALYNNTKTCLTNANEQLQIALANLPRGIADLLPKTGMKTLMGRSDELVECLANSQFNTDRPDRFEKAVNGANYDLGMYYGAVTQINAVIACLEASNTTSNKGTLDLTEASNRLAIARNALYGALEGLVERAVATGHGGWVDALEQKFNSLEYYATAQKSVAHILAKGSAVLAPSSHEAVSQAADSKVAEPAVASESLTGSLSLWGRIQSAASSMLGFLGLSARAAESTSVAASAPQVSQLSTATPVAGKDITAVLNTSSGQLGVVIGRGFQRGYEQVLAGLSSVAAEESA